MSEVYRGHEIFILEQEPRCAVIFERQTGFELPTKITALPNEGIPACLSRARQLIDIYLETPIEGERRAS